MKKYMITNVVLFLMGLICLTASHAATYTPPKAWGDMISQSAPTQGVMGKVVAVDTAKSELAVKDEKGTEKIMSIAPTTRITKEGKDITLAEVKAGDRVMYELESASDPPVAKMLLVMAMKSAKR